MSRSWTLVVLALSVVLASCGGSPDADGQGNSVETTTTSVASQTTMDDSAPATSEGVADDDSMTTSDTGMNGVHVADSNLGEILVGPDGLTLYVFTADSDGTSTCYGACADLWPPVPADVEISSDLDQSKFGSTTREDGSEQLTVNGMPLYWYTPDEMPGDTMGQGFNDVWFVVDATGDMMETSAAGTGDAVIDYDY